MAISLDEVNRIAKLSRLNFNDEQKQKLQHELSAILDYVDQLKEIEGKKDLDLAEDKNSFNLMRDDVAEPVANPSEFISQAPATQDGFVKVKSILE